MSGRSAYCVEGVIVASLAPGVFRVELPNGHCLVGYGFRRDREELLGLNLSDRVQVELAPYDLSKGRIRPKQSDKS